MTVDRDLKFRLSVLSELVKASTHKPGRTALMKFAYMLQVVRHVPLDYRFELYNYGPYDSTVLSDLSQAVTLKAVKSDVVYYQSGYGYEYSTNEKGHAALRAKVAEDLEKYEDDIRWVLGSFGGDSASRLELVTTIIFAEREAARKKTPHSLHELCCRVKKIKPHFDHSVIEATSRELESKKLIAPSA